jgi:diadenosine tetraphosphate (Ap4A) HIT family hydrolase
MNCPFCRIAKGELFAHLLYEDDQVLSFLDAAPMAPGHALIVPARMWSASLSFPRIRLAAFSP